MRERRLHSFSPSQLLSTGTYSRWSIESGEMSALASRTRCAGLRICWPRRASPSTSPTAVLATWCSPGSTCSPIANSIARSTSYAGLVGLTAGLIENVTDGTNAWLVGLDDEGHLLATEEAIVDATRPHRVRDIFLVDRPLTDEERRQVDASPGSATRVLSERVVTPALNPRLANTLAFADLIIYAPGTQHSSLFPSYLTPGLSAAIAANLSAIKLLITNIQSDAEITGSNAVDIIDRAVFYLKEKGRVAFPTPCLITHYLLNDPGHDDAVAPYVPLGPLDSIEDPRLVRIGNYEDGVTGRHDAARVLGPFLDGIATAERRKRVAVLLHDAGSTNKVVQTLLEMVRGGVDRLPLDLTVFFAGEPLEATFTAHLPFAVTSYRAAIRRSHQWPGAEALTTSRCSSRPACTEGKIWSRSSRSSRSGDSTRCGGAAGCRSATSRSPTGCGTARTCCWVPSATSAATRSALRICSSTAAISRTRCRPFAPCAPLMRSIRRST